MTVSQRDYGSICRNVNLVGTRLTRMQKTVDALWDGLWHAGVSWVGFYLDRPDQADDRRLELGPCRDKPACSPIGLHGVCGQALRLRQVRIVSDVRELGGNYVACDPRDRSEIVVPLMEASGECWGVLDLDSWETASFAEADAIGLRLVLTAAGL